MALKYCCCGCSVKTGALIVGYVYAVLSAIGLLLCVLFMLVVGDISEQHEPGDELASTQAFLKVKDGLSRIYLLGSVICLKTLLVNCLMIHGINRTKPAYVLPWIIFFGVGMVIQSWASISAIEFASTVPMSVCYLFTAALMFYFLLEAYILVVVTSHYHRMKKSSLLDEEQMML